MAVQVNVSRDIFQRGAFSGSHDIPTTARAARQARVVKPARPARPASPVQPLVLHPQILQARRRRRSRRLRQAGEALVWMAGSGALATLVMGGLLGLR